MPTASEMIEALQELMQEHGDKECVDEEGTPLAMPEECDGDFVLCEKR